jgi:predicted acylesterase/phospholipase RssA
MARITSPDQVRYLALEGGGGKGVTYLGAIRVLEDLGVLPINIDKPGQNQIRGISGASAGAITAMFLAMGYTSEDLEQVLSNQSTFTGFFDGPDTGVSRLVNRDNRPEMRTDAPRGVRPSEFLQQQSRSISGISRLASALALLARQAGSSSDPIVARLVAQPDAYLFNFIFERGLFPGFAPRTFLQNAVYSRLWDRLNRSGTAPGQPLLIRSVNGSELNFREFHKLTGVDLVITGANVTKHKPAVFSSRHTPLFPVAEAVGISMNLPFLFKPVHVEANVPVGPLNSRADDYHGMWIDGGVLNNFPLHAFDHLMPPVSAVYPGLKPLNPAMLGLRLTEGPPVYGPSPPPERFDILLEHMANIMGTVFYPSEEGQIRNDDERSQTIDLFTFDLSTTDFAPPPSKSATPIAEAERAVRRYFGI